MFSRLQLRRTLNEFPVLLAIPKPLSVPAYQILTQVFFERFNVAAFSVNDRAVCQIFATSQATGTVVDVDEYTTDITCLIEGIIQPGATTSIPIGVQDCLRHLANILSTNPNLVNAFSPQDAPLPPDELRQKFLRLAEYLFQNGHVAPPATASVVAPTNTEGGNGDDDPSANLASILVAGKEKALIEANSKKKTARGAGAAEREKEKERQALDLIDVDFEGKKITLGRERHRMCEPLLDSDWVKNAVRSGMKDDLTCATIPQAMVTMTRDMDVGIRQTVWEVVQVTGKLTAASSKS